ncbi:uncharacterized protein MKK02DRAFT_31570 [Dioszegia hungarica]|uniref:Uncharacterized protein n=1 Tax=Dioszegia hungarica TaxID=4972 RepID=A0AA38HDJ7_9TREE|nr:uncharacterized protein MKK02DRAFT_31570 [Dioszegia hungarica]KAI9638062.1 hypothetical protein MKK02DRAFT_31570 [Dioszegia hungarica]
MPHSPELFGMGSRTRRRTHTSHSPYCRCAYSVPCRGSYAVPSSSPSSLATELSLRSRISNIGHLKHLDLKEDRVRKGLVRRAQTQHCSVLKWALLGATRAPTKAAPHPLFPALHHIESRGDGYIHSTEDAVYGLDNDEEEHHTQLGQILHLYINLERIPAAQVIDAGARSRKKRQVSPRFNICLGALGATGRAHPCNGGVRIIRDWIKGLSNRKAVHDICFHTDNPLELISCIIPKIKWPTGTLTIRNRRQYDITGSRTGHLMLKGEVDYYTELFKKIRSAIPSPGTNERVELYGAFQAGHNVDEQVREELRRLAYDKLRNDIGMNHRPTVLWRSGSDRSDTKGLYVIVREERHRVTAKRLEKTGNRGLLPLSPVNVNIMGYLHAGGKSRALIMRLRLLLRVRGRKTTFELQTGPSLLAEQAICTAAATPRIGYILDIAQASALPTTNPCRHIQGFPPSSTFLSMRTELNASLSPHFFPLRYLTHHSPRYPAFITRLAVHRYLSRTNISPPLSNPFQSFPITPPIMDPLLTPRLPVELVTHICDILRVRADSSALCAILRSSSVFYDIAAPKIYRRVRLSQANIQMFLLGMALIREGDSPARGIDCRPFGDPASGDGGPLGKEKHPDELRWEGKVQLFRYIEELQITGLFDADKEDGEGYDHGDIAKWAFGKSSYRRTSSLSLPDRLLPSLRRIELHAVNTGCQQPALQLDLRRHAVSPDGTTFRGSDLCVRAHSNLSLLDTPKARLAPSFPPKGTARYYVDESTGPPGPGAPASGTDTDPAIRAWRNLYLRSGANKYRLRVFGAFRNQASESDERSVRDATIADLTGYGGKHLREVADAPLADRRGGLWFAPSGYMEGCMCGEATQGRSERRPNSATQPSANALHRHRRPLGSPKAADLSRISLASTMITVYR